MLRAFLAVAIFVSITCCCLPVRSARAQEPQGAGGGRFEASRERLGGLRLGMTEKEVNRIVRSAPRKDKEVFEGATGGYVQMWKYPDRGIVLAMGSARKGGPKGVNSIEIVAPCELATSRGIRIGSAESEVVKAYGKYRDREGATKKGVIFVAGSLYDGVIFDFRDGLVVRIFLGAAAE